MTSDRDTIEVNAAHDTCSGTAQVADLERQLAEANDHRQVLVLQLDDERRQRAVDSAASERARNELVGQVVGLCSRIDELEAASKVSSRKAVSATWEMVCDAPRNRVRRLRVHGGWLYQAEGFTVVKSMERDVADMRHCGWTAPVFVPECAAAEP